MDPKQKQTPSLVNYSFISMEKNVQDDSERIVFALSYMKGGTAGPWAKLKVKQLSAAQEIVWSRIPKHLW